MWCVYPRVTRYEEYRAIHGFPADEYNCKSIFVCLFVWYFIYTFVLGFYQIWCCIDNVIFFKIWYCIDTFILGLICSLGLALGGYYFFFTMNHDWTNLNRIYYMYMSGSFHVYFLISDLEVLGKKIVRYFPQIYLDVKLWSSIVAQSYLRGP